jgi:hypothetical protein
VSFEYFPILLAGVCFGPLAGASSAVSPIFGSDAFIGLGFFPPLIGRTILAGLLSGLLAKYAFRG